VLETAALIEMTRGRVPGEHAQDQPPHTPLAGPIDRRVEQRRPDAPTLAGRIDRQTLHFEDVAARLEVGPGTEQEAAEDRAVGDRHQHVLGAVALDDRPLGVGRRAGVRTGRPGGELESAQCRLVALPCGADLDRAQLSFAAFRRQ
jgi:hypothetical protein